MDPCKMLIVVIFAILENLNLGNSFATGQVGVGNDTSLSTASMMVTTLLNEQYTRIMTSDCDDTSANSTERDSCSDMTSTTMSSVPIIDTGSMSRETFQSFEKVARYLQFFLIGFGFVANICNIVVFTQRSMRSATSTILTFLSGSELGFALSELIVSAYATSMGTKAYTSRLYWILIRWVRVYMTAVFQKSAFCFNLSVATERFIAVSFPLKANNILRRKNPVVFCTVMFFVILSVHVFNPLKMDVVTVNTARGSIYVIRSSYLYKENPDVFEGLTLAAKILFVYIPLFGCLLMNIMMVVALMKHSRKRKLLQINQGQPQTDRREVQTTVTILVSSFVFALFSLPVTTFSIVQSLNPEYRSQKREHYLYTFVMYLSGLLALLSLSFDFIVYMILSRAYRQTFLYLAIYVYRAVRCFSAKRSSSVEMSVNFDKKDSYSMKTEYETDTTIE